MSLLTLIPAPGAGTPPSATPQTVPSSAAVPSNVVEANQPIPDPSDSIIDGAEHYHAVMEQEAAREAAREAGRPFGPWANAYHLPADSPLLDTAPKDTLYYIMLEPETTYELQPPVRDTEGSDIMSWILTALTLLFVVVAIRFRSNSKYLSAMFRDAVEVRERRNVFDDTVREDSFMIILNALWCLSVGVLLYTTVQFSAGDPFIGERLRQAGLSGLPPGGFSASQAPLGMGISIGVAIVWQLMMITLYAVVGRVFSDARHARMWVSGYLSVSGLSTLIFFPLALLAICYPGDRTSLLCVALGGFIIAKLIFIIKGFRIFFKEVTSWLLFLYYLCSLEIVPLVLLYVATLLLCATIL